MYRIAIEQDSGEQHLLESNRDITTVEVLLLEYCFANYSIAERRMAICEHGGFVWTWVTVRRVGTMQKEAAYV